MVSNALSTYVAYGLAAAMPATPATGTGVSALYFQTDTGLLFAWNGSSMVQAGGNPAETLITEVVTSGSQATVTFSSISATYRDLILRVRGRGDTAAALTQVLLQFNGDTGANYDQIEFEALTASASGNANVQALAQTSAGIGYLPAATATATVGGLNELLIADYRGTTFEKAASYTTALKRGTGTSDFFVMAGSIFWRSTAAITEIDVSLSAGNFVDGSVVSLYGSL